MVDTERTHNENVEYHFPPLQPELPLRLVLPPVPDRICEYCGKPMERRDYHIDEDGMGDSWTVFHLCCERPNWLQNLIKKVRRWLKRL